MSAQALQHTRSGRFVRVYLITWGLLAACGLTYLASLAWHVDLQLPQRQQQAEKPAIDPGQGLRVANKALAEIDSVQHTVGEMQKDLGRLKETVGQREAQDKESQSRLASLEERVSSLATPAPANIVTVPPSKQKAAEKAKAAAEKRASEQRATSRIVTVIEGPTPTPELPAAADPPAAPPKLETGSIPASPPAITFGEPEVTPVRQAYTVQLGSGPSLDALRMSWLALRDQHGDALGSLQPRFVAPRNGNGSYRLVAGPLTSKADADKVCAEMGLGRDACFATTALGQPF
jgi:sporulation related protein